MQVEVGVHKLRHGLPGYHGAYRGPRKGYYTRLRSHNA